MPIIITLRSVCFRRQTSSNENFKKQTFFLPLKDLSRLGSTPIALPVFNSLRNRFLALFVLGRPRRWRRTPTRCPSRISWWPSGKLSHQGSSVVGCVETKVHRLHPKQKEDYTGKGKGNHWNHYFGKDHHETTTKILNHHLEIKNAKRQNSKNCLCLSRICQDEFGSWRSRRSTPETKETNRSCCLLEKNIFTKNKNKSISMWCVSMIVSNIKRVSISMSMFSLVRLQLFILDHLGAFHPIGEEPLARWVSKNDGKKKPKI